MSTMTSVLSEEPIAVPARSSDRKARTRYVPQLDGLRFLAFLAVYFQHTFHAAPDYYLNWAVLKPLHLSAATARIMFHLTLTGGMGVDLFFALSSYLITDLLLREIKETGKIHLKYFYARRVLRIWPVYGLVLFLGMALIPALGLGQAIPSVYVASFLLFAGNWSLAFLGVPVALLTISPLWSISVEEQFYLLWPLAIHKFGIRHLKWLCIALIAMGELSRLILCTMHVPDDLRYFNTFMHLDPIAWGALLALGTEHQFRRWTGFQRMLLGAACVGISLFALLSVDTGGRYLTALLAIPLYGVACAAIIFLAFQSKALSLKPFPYLGKISFGLYAYHAMIIIFLDKVVAKGSWMKLIMIPTKLLVTITVASLSYKFLEAPILRFKARFTYVKSRPV